MMALECHGKRLPIAPKAQMKHKNKAFLFQSTINNGAAQVTTRAEAALQSVLLEEDLRIHGAAGGVFGSPVWFDQLQLSIGQVFLSNLWQGDFPLWFE